MYGHTGPALAFGNMTNRDYRHHAYRTYIDFLYGLLGRHVRKVIPACIVDHIRTTWPDPDGKYVGFIAVNEEDGTPLHMDELEEL